MIDSYGMAKDKPFEDVYTFGNELGHLRTPITLRRCIIESHVAVGLELKCTIIHWIKSNSIGKLLDVKRSFVSLVIALPLNVAVSVPSDEFAAT